MPVREEAVRRSLRLAAEDTVDIEPLGMRAEAPARVAIRSGGSTKVVLARAAGFESAQNHAAVLEALERSGVGGVPRLVAVDGELVVEEWIEGVSALAVMPPPGAAEAAIDALAQLHSAPVREGLDWDKDPGDVLPPPEIPLHRLGFAASERDPAREPLAAAHAALCATPFGFAHRDATAAHVLLAPGRAWMVSFGAAGFGPQLFDVAAFLLTSGLEAAGRSVLATRYGRERGLAVDAADVIDLAGLIWGLNELLRLPRRQVEALGDDAATEALRTEALRIERGIRTPAGDHPAAAAIRAALWHG